MRAETNEGNKVPILIRTQDQEEPHHSGSVVRQPEHFIGLEEIPEDLKTDPSNYNKVIQDKDATLWQKAMNTEMESKYSN